MMAMLRQYLREGSGHARLILGEKREETIINRETLNELAANNPTLNVTFVLSDPNWEWTERIGYAQEHLEELFDAFIERDFLRLWDPADGRPEERALGRIGSLRRADPQ